MPCICSKSLTNLYCQEDKVQNPEWSLLEQILPTVALAHLSNSISHCSSSTASPSKEDQESMLCASPSQPCCHPMNAPRRFVSLIYLLKFPSYSFLHAKLLIMLRYPHNRSLFMKHFLNFPPPSKLPHLTQNTWMYNPVVIYQFTSLCLFSTTSRAGTYLLLFYAMSELQ